MEFALFSNRRHAAHALETVRNYADADAMLFTEASELTCERIPLCLTMARFGTVLGAAAVAAMFTAGFVSMIGLEFGAFEKLLASPVVSVMTLALLSALLGALAGALSFSTEVQRKLEHLRGLLRYEEGSPDDEHPAALLLDSTDELDEMLREEGAVKTESLT